MVDDAAPRDLPPAGAPSEVRRERPTPLDEVRGGLIVFEQSLWHALPRYLRELDRALQASTGRGLPLEAAPIRFGSWIGGDRDGNPNVTPEVTRQACLLARWVAADLYLREIDALRDELSLTDASPELRAAVGDAHEPYRELLRERARAAAWRRARARMASRRRSERRSRHAAPEPMSTSTPRSSRAPLRLCHDRCTQTGKG